MEAAFEGVIDYQANLEVREFKEDGTFETKRMRYSFKKPNHIRVDFLSPYAGAVAVYPHDEGKVLLRPPGLFQFLKLPLARNSSLAQVSPGQPLNKTDLGLLIQSIRRSVTHERKGPLNISSSGKSVTIQVLADNHFRKDLVTHYTFVIDKILWLPILVEEASEDKRKIRMVFFNDLNLDLGLEDKYFRLD